MRTCETCDHCDIDTCRLDEDKPGAIPGGPAGPWGEHCQQHSDQPSEPETVKESSDTNPLP